MHSLRHTFATRCIERGVSIKALQRLMGHANIATTLDIYVHVSDDFLRDAMQIFEMEDEQNTQGREINRNVVIYKNCYALNPGVYLHLEFFFEKILM